MATFFEILLLSNGALFTFGCLNLLGAVIFLLMSRLQHTKVLGVNAWLKPFKFALSVAIFSWTMGWYTGYLNAPSAINVYNWVVIVCLGFEVLYIAVQAARGQMSHYNLSSPLYSFLLFMMIVAAAVPTLWTGYIGLLISKADLPTLPDYYVLSIKIGIALFVIFAFEGPLMGGRRSHTVGNEDSEGPRLPILKWSTKHGDLRIAHFVGMHALQVLPLLSFYVLKNVTATVIAGLLYAALAIFTMVQALRGRPLIGYDVNRKPVTNN